MEAWITMPAAFALGVAASFYGSMTSGASMLSLPGLIWLGLPADVAVATNKLGDLGRFTTAGYRFNRAGKVVWRYVWILAPLATLGGIVGARLLTLIEPRQLNTAIGVLLLLLVALMYLRRDFGAVQGPRGRLRERIGYLVYFAAAVYGAALQLGSGPLILWVVMAFFGLTVLQANATSSICWLFLTVSSLAGFVYYGLVDYRLGLALGAGSAVGGYLGSHTAIKKGEHWTKNVLAVVIVLIAVKILLATD